MRAPDERDRVRVVMTGSAMSPESITTIVNMDSPMRNCASEACAKWRIHDVQLHIGE